MSKEYQSNILGKGTQIIHDPNTGNYYTFVNTDNSHRKDNGNHKQQNQSQFHQVNLKPLQSTTQARHRISNQTTSTNQFIQEKQSGSGQNNIQRGSRLYTNNTNPGMQDSRTYRSTEQEQCDSNENLDEGRNDESSPVDNEDQLESYANVNKRALNDSNDFVTVGSNKIRKNNHNNRATSMNHNEQHNTTTSNMSQNKYSIPIEYIQRAVTHNLPCFTINFNNSNQLPSAVSIAEDLYDHFSKQKIQITESFSMVRYIGKLLKIGVKNKSDFQKLNDSNVWPSEIQGNTVSVKMPMFIPDQFTLVVRNIPTEYTIEQVAAEVKKSASSAENFKLIIYPYTRSMNDYRFNVSNQKEYNGLLRLGQIGVFNRLRLVTPYRLANRLSYCTRCWNVDHTRDKCEKTIQKCRICLCNFNDQHNERCSKIYKCAQCGKCHFSLDAECEVIQQYRAKLNRAVKQAEKDGLINYKANATARPDENQPPDLNNQAMFPSLTATTGYTKRSAPWKNFNLHYEAVQAPPNDISNQQLFEKLCTHFEGKSNQMDTHIHQIEQEVNENAKKIKELHQNLTNMIGIFKSFVTDITAPLSKLSPKGDNKTREMIKRIIAGVNEQVEILLTNSYESELQVVENINQNQQEVELSKNTSFT